jgi:NAD(P)-dependent dehydrogenase (short-subunit alcohol dehydrogenase family)
MVKTAVDTYGGLHVLYNNAGIFPGDDGGVLDTPQETWRRVMAVNLEGVWLGCRAGIPALLASGGGAIVNVASFVALMGAATAQIAYTASKGGVLSMTREIAVEYARQHPANALCPGPIARHARRLLRTPPAGPALVHIPITGRRRSCEGRALPATTLLLHDRCAARRGRRHHRRPRMSEPA